MVYSEVLLVLTALSGLKAQGGGIVPPINEDDPELYIEWTTPKNAFFYRDYTSRSTFVGNLLAGRAEFPYVVRITSSDLDVEKWGIGNLITFTHVLTSARQVDFIIKVYDQIVFDKLSSDLTLDEGLLISMEYVTAKIMYCANYLYEDYKFNQLTFEGFDMFDHDVSESGTRYVRFMYKHPMYKRDHLSYDVGIMRTNYPIRPMPPLLDYMPVWFDPERQSITDVDLHLMDDQRRVCYIASFGSQWFNYQVPVDILNYKVRYRVYWMDLLTECVPRLPLYQRTVEVTPLHYDPDADSNMMCFRSRAEVGSVCDHDRGAPLVCDNRVYGFVSRAANFTFCNNLLPLPFMVLKASALNSYYQQISANVFRPRFRPIPKSRSGRHLVGSNTIIFTFVVSFWIG